MPINATQDVVANSDRIRTELGYREPVPIDDAVRATIAWEQANPPTGKSFHQFDYDAEDAALASLSTADSRPSAASDPNC
jgi:hypothetical protein